MGFISVQLALKQISQPPQPSPRCGYSLTVLHSRAGHPTCLKETNNLLYFLAFEKKQIRVCEVVSVFRSNLAVCGSQNSQPRWSQKLLS